MVMHMSLEQDYKKLNDKIEKIIAENQKKIVKEYKKSLEELRTEIRQMYDRYDLQEDKLTLEEVAKYDRLQKLDKKVEDTYKALYEHNRKITKSTLENVFKTSVDGSISPIEAVTGKKLYGITKTLEIEKTVNERMAGLHWAERLGHHRNDVIYATQKTLKEGLAQGSTYRELSDRLKTELEGNVIQPMRIIRTESGRVYAKAQQESLDKVSKQVDMVKTWHTAKDERVRGRKAGDKTNHVDMEGQTVLYEEDFVFPDGTQTEAPRMSGVAGHDIHCRCWMSVDLADENYIPVFPNMEITDVRQFPEYPLLEIVQMSSKADEIVGKYVSIPTKWSGHIVFYSRTSPKIGRKNWNCSISIHRHTDMYVLIHEHLHSRSISYFNKRVYVKYHVIEEGTVELLTKIIAKKEGYALYEGGYEKYVDGLKKYNDILKIHSNIEDFAINLIKIPVPERLDYLTHQFEQKMRMLTITEAREVYEIIQLLGG